MRHNFLDVVILNEQRPKENKTYNDIPANKYSKSTIETIK